MVNRTRRFAALTGLAFLAGCAHFSTVPEAGRWQHPQVKAGEQAIVALLRKVDVNRGWKFLNWNSKLHRAHLTFTTPMGFVDDIVIQMSGNEQVTQLMIDSHSRTGWYDFGQNRKHIADLIALLRQKFAMVNPMPQKDSPNEAVQVVPNDDLRIRRLPGK